MFSHCQNGFPLKHSTEYAVLQLHDYITRQLAINKTPFNIFIDLSKAFDTMNHNILIKKMKYYGIKLESCNILISYLANRIQCVVFKEATASLLNIHTGVPQGSILSPLLILIYINDLPLFTSQLNAIMYADDTTIYRNK